MPVRKATAQEILGGKTLVMSASPAILRGLKKLQEARSQTGVSADATSSSGRKKAQR
jgi:hypothetical protein